MEKNYEKLQLDEQKSIDRWMMINTAFTILTGITTLVLAILTYLR